MENSGPILKTVGKSKTSPVGNKQGKVCYADVFKLTDLPVIMDKKGWKVSSALMRKWFDNPAHTMNSGEKEGKTSPKQYPANLIDTSAVTMSWALSFPRVKKEYDSIFGSKGIFSSTPALYESARAKEILVRRLLAAKKFTAHPEPFGNFSGSVLDINEQWQFQRLVVDDNSEYAKTWVEDTATGDPGLDDMWGALARFLFKIAGAGTVTPRTREVDTGLKCTVEVEYYEISVSKIGVYVRDTYDFNGDQYLGHWSKTSSPYVRVFPLSYSVGGRGQHGNCPDDFVSVSNEKYVAHRKITGKGGDLLVFSDVLITTLKKPFTFRMTPKEIKAIESAIR